MSIKIIDFTPDNTLTGIDNALARKAHYESECARINALSLVEAYKRNTGLEFYIDTRKSNDRTE